MKVTVRVKDVVLLGSCVGGLGCRKIVVGSLVLPHSGASFLTLLDTGSQGLWEEEKPRFGMKMGSACLFLTLGWPVWAGPPGRGELARNTEGACALCLWLQSRLPHL